jgi:hypothetical protein
MTECSEKYGGFITILFFVIWCTAGVCFSFMIKKWKNQNDIDMNEVVPAAMLGGMLIPAYWFVYLILRRIFLSTPLYLFVQSKKHLNDMWKWQRNDTICYLTGIVHKKAQLLMWDTSEALVEEEDKYSTTQKFIKMKYIVCNDSLSEREKEKKFNDRKKIMEELNKEIIIDKADDESEEIKDDTRIRTRRYLGL